jgi:hypothetical protein
MLRADARIVAPQCSSRLRSTGSSSVPTVIVIATEVHHMSYRNDHDAALARVDALEAELEQMAGDYEQARAALAERTRPVPRRRTRNGPVVALLLAATSISAGVALVLTASPSEPEAPVAARARAAADIPPASVDLVTCLDGIEASMRVETVFDAETTDPRGALARSPQPITGFVASCRPELARAASDGSLDARTRALFSDWQAREDELTGAISRIVVYYGSDPYQLNGYATAGQLWREFDRARESRDALIRAESPALRRAVAY